MEKEFREKFSGRVLSGYGGDGMYLHPTGSGYPLMPELKSFLLANNDKLAQVITAELIKKLEEDLQKDSLMAKLTPENIRKAARLANEAQLKTYNKVMKEHETDLSKLHDMLTEKGIEHVYKKHPAAVAEPQAAKLLGMNAHPVGTHQILIGDISIIRGFASFGLFELYGGGFEADRFTSEEEVLEALKKTI